MRYLSFPAAILMSLALAMPAMANEENGNGGHHGKGKVYNKAESQSYAGSNAQGYVANHGSDVSITSNSDVDGPDLGDTVPNVFAPSLAGGANPCIVSVSGGFSVSGFGGTLGAAVNDGECQIRETVRILGALLRGSANPQAALVIKGAACQSPIMWDSLELAATEAGQPDMACKNERPSDPSRQIALRRPDQLPASFEEEAQALRSEPQTASRMTSTSKSKVSYLDDQSWRTNK